jgi:glycosyltransferase involved in cell wall biosynthesis
VAAASEPWHVTIVGEGPGRADLGALVQALGVADRVHLEGWLDGAEVRDRYDGAWLACLACVVAADGERDGIPVALMEAMARGVPVVTTDLGGIPELVAGAGIVVPSGDVMALAAALDSLADAGERTRVGALGRDRVRQAFSVRTSARQVAQLVGTSVEQAEEEASRGVGSAAP